MVMTKGEVSTWCRELAQHINNDPVLLSAFIKTYDARRGEDHMTSIKSEPITWHVDRLMCDCGGEFKHTINISYADKPFGHVCDKCNALEVTEYVYPRTVWVES